ncbi:MAG: c-type cytochrome domain-containing protein [Deltaproteobacteria bacterium]
MKKALTLLTRFVLVGVLTCGCRDDGMLIAEQIPPEPMASGQVRLPPSEIEVEKAAVQNLLIDNCGSCHATAATRPPHSLETAPSSYGGDPIADIADIDALVELGLIEPGLPEESPLWFVMVSGQMPPPTSGQSPVSEAEVRRLEKFIVRMNPPTQREVVDILLRTCGSCHGASAGGVVIAINDIGDLALLVAAGLIVPGDRDQSRVYTRILDGEMPPEGSGARPMSNRELARLGGFIDLLR